MTIIPSESKRGDSDGNGLAEVAVREIKGMVRTLKLSVERRCGRELPMDHPVVLWSANYAGYLINRCNVSRKFADGLTPWQRERRRGTGHKTTVPRYGEVVHYAPGDRKTKAQGNARFVKGMHLLGCDLSYWGIPLRNPRGCLPVAHRAPCTGVRPSELGVPERHQGNPMGAGAGETVGHPLPDRVPGLRGRAYS
jgi:hypothetical protein